MLCCSITDFCWGPSTATRLLMLRWELVGVGVVMVMAGDEFRSRKSIGVPPVCCAHMKAMSEYGKLPLNAGDGVDNTKGDAEATFMKLYGSIPCVGVGVKSIVSVLCRAIAGSY